MFMYDEILTINGEGKQSCDFMYIDKVMEINLKASISIHEATDLAHNVARECLIDIYYVLKKILE